MKYSYYPGCTLRTKAKDLDEYARASATALGFELEEIEDWQCCGGVYPLGTDEIATKLSSVRALNRAKEKGQGGGAWCAAALAFCLHWRCDLLRRVRPGAYRGRWWSAPRSGAGLLVPALIRAQRFRLHLIRLHGCRWRCFIRCVFAVCRRGQILHFTG